MRIGLALLALMFCTAAGSDLSGRWMTQEGDAVIDIFPCGDLVCGRVAGVTVDHPGDPPPVDAHGRPQCGETIIGDMRAMGPNLWRGHIEDPRDESVWRAEMSLDPAGHLRLHGYIGLPLFGRTEIWSRFAGAIGPDCLMTGHPRT